MSALNYKKDNSYIAAANIQLILGAKLFMNVLKVFIFLGFISYIVIFFSSYVELNSLTIFLLKLMGFIGLVALVLYIFSTLYFKWMEEKDGLFKDSNEKNLYRLIDLELAIIFSKFDLSKVKPQELMNSLLRSPRVIFVCNEMNVQKEHISHIVENISAQEVGSCLENIFALAIENAIKEKENKITTADLFYGFIKQVSNFSSFASSLELEEGDISSVIFWANRTFNDIKYPESIIEKLKNTSYGIGEDWAYGYTLFLDRYGVNINDPRFFNAVYTVGRKETISELEEYLSKDQGNNCLIVGKPGVGKKTLVYALAGKLFTGESRREIKHFRVVHLSVDKLMAGAKNPEEVEQRILSVLKDAANSGNVILYIENIHVLFQLSEKIGTIDATEVLSPYLAGGEVRIIGTTTDREYQSCISPKESLSNLFHIIKLEPTDKEHTIKILEDISLHYSSKYKIRITFSGLKEIYKVSNDFVSETEFPRKAIDLLEQALDCAKRSDKKVLDSHSIDTVCQEILKIPIAQATSMDKDILNKLETSMHKRIVSQKEAVTAVVGALKRKKAQVHDSKKPIGVFLFLGPTGVGKTEVAKTLAANYFGDEGSIIRIDMNQLRGSSALGEILGTKISGKDQLEGGSLVRGVREKPFSVILLDELEKAPQDVLNLFLQIFDEGYAKDGMGNDVSFSNTIIIATSNAKADMVRKGVKGGGNDLEFKEKIIDALQGDGIFTPEFLNRFDDIVLFKSLSKEDIKKIAFLMVEEIKSNFEKKGYEIKVEDSVLEYLSEKGYQPEFGARPMKRAVQDILENYLADKILKDDIIKGQALNIKVSDIS